jgi:glutaredoxin
MMKKLLITFLTFIGLFSFANFAKAEINLNDDKIDIDFFYSKTCSHCSDANEFLNKISLEDSDIKIQKFDISQKDSLKLLLEYYDDYNVEEVYRGGVPAIFIENNYFIGFQKDYSEDSIESVINAFIEKKDVDKNNDLIGDFSEIENLKKEIKLPFVGNIKLENTSPLIFSIIFGALDGFNACAMAALAFLLAVLIGMGDRKRLILLGGIFILVSGIVYYLFIAAWLNIFLILPHLDIITHIIGILIIIFGIFILKEYFDGVICKLCELDPQKSNWFSRNQKKLMLKVQEIINSEKSIFFIIGGVIFIAVGINSIELICSFGLPVAFTKILTSYNLSSVSYYFYLLIYDIFYMLDDFIIFLIAVFTFNLAQESERYIRAAKFISGILLIILGIIIIFFPDVLGSI